MREVHCECGCGLRFPTTQVVVRRNAYGRELLYIPHAIEVKFRFKRTGNKKSGVYLIYCSVNHKVYVGRAVNLGARRSQHFTSLKFKRHHCTHLQRAYDKYGADAFVFGVLEYCEPEKLAEIEQFYLDTIPRKRRFNTAQHSTAPMLGRHHPEETIEKLRHHRNSRVETPEQIQSRIRKRLETIKSRYAVQYGSRAVEQIDPKSHDVITVFDSISAAAAAIGIGTAGISRICNNSPCKGYVPKTSGGFIWKFSGETR